MDKTTNQDQWEHGLDLIRQAGLEGEPAADSSTPWFAAEDLYRAPIGGVTHFGESLLDLGTKPLNAGIWAYNKLTNDDVNYLEAPDLLGDFDESRSVAGHLVSGITQFTLGTMLGTKLLEGAGIAAKIGQGGKVLSSGLTGLARTAAIDTAAGALAFKGTEGRLADLVQSVPALRNPLTEFFASSPDDNWAEARLKTAIEGTGIGLLMHPLISVLKAGKGLLIAEKGGDAKVIAEAAARFDETRAAWAKAVEEDGGSFMAVRSEEDLRQALSKLPGLSDTQVEEAILNLRRRAASTGKTLEEAAAETMGIVGVTVDHTPEGLAGSLEQRVKPALPSYIAKGLTEEEKVGLRADTIQRVVEIADALSSDATLLEGAKAGAAKRGWYANAAQTLRDGWGEDANRFAALVAAYSPRQRVKDNLIQALAVWTKWVEGGRPTDENALRGIFKSVPKGEFEAHLQNAMRVLQAKEVTAETLSSSVGFGVGKVPSFYLNLIGDLNAVTLDVWMSSILGINEKALGTKAGYLAGSAAVRRVADRLGWAPAEVQETVWSFMSSLSAARTGGKSGDEALQILTHEAIASTPDFATILLKDPDVAQRIQELERLQPGLTGRIRASLEGQRGPSAPGEAATLTGRIQTDRPRLLGRLAKLAPEPTGGRGRAGLDEHLASEVAGVVDAGSGSGGNAAGAGILRPDEPLRDAPPHATPNPTIREQRSGYLAEAGLPDNPVTTYAQVDVERAKRIAQAYTEMVHAPNDPKVRASYEALARETKAQFEYLVKQGVQFEPWTKAGQPYATSREMAADAARGHLYYFPSENGFGDGISSAAAENPLLANSGVVVAGKEVPYNDLFRAVHDYFGHAMEGTTFGPIGEENAWRSHARMYSQEARGAMTTETRGQNSWVNYGPKGEWNQANKAQTIYAEQKTGLLPEEFWKLDEEGAAKTPGGAPKTLAQTVLRSEDNGLLKGAVSFMDDGSAILHVFTKATDISTIEHELTHVWRRRLSAQDLEAVSKALGIPAGQQWSRETEEAFAKQYEAWLAGTKASPELESAFGKYKQWMADAYRDVTDSPLGDKVNPELAKFFEARYGDALSQTPKAIPPEALNAAMDRLVSTLDQTKDLSRASEELGQNLSKWLVDRPVQQAFAEIADAAYERMTKLRGGIGGVESLKMTSDFADVLGSTPEAVVGFFRQYAEDAHRMAAMQSAGRSMLQAMSDQVLTAAKRVQSEGSNAARVELLQWAEKLSNFYGDVTATQTGFARATSAGRIVRGPSSRLPTFTPSRIEETIRSSRGRGTGGSGTGTGGGPGTGTGGSGTGTGGGPGTGTGGSGTGTGGGPGTGTGGSGTGIGGGIRRLPGAKIAEIISGGGGEKGVDQLADLIIKTVGPDGLEGNGGAAKALNRVLVRRNNVTNALIEWRMNAMLSSPKTLAVNQLSNAVQVLLQPAEKIVGGVLTANPESIKQGFAIYGATARYFRESLTMARRALMSGDSLLDSFGDTKLAGAISSQAFGASNTSLLGQAIDALGTATRMPTRLMMTSEEFFKQLNYRAFLHQDIMERALARFKDPEDIARFFAEQWEASFDKLGRGINDDAMAYARNATFSTPLTYGVGKSLQEMVVRNPWMRLVLPFVKTPTNLIRNVWAHTPLLGAFQRQWAEDFAAGGVRRSQAVGKWAVGGLIFGTAATYAIDGVITGGGPSDPDAKKTKLLSGWQPYSIVTTGPDGKKRYVSFNRLDPGGMMLGLAADIVEAGAEIKDGDYETLAGHAISAVAKNLTSKSYLMSLSDALAVLEDPDRRAERYMQKLAASFVPRGLDTVNGDPYLREAVTIMDGVRARVPGLSDKLSARRNLFGEKVPVGQAFGPDFVSPFAFSKEVPDDVNQELGRLGRGFSLPDHRVLGLDLRTLKNEKGQDAYDRLMELVGSGDFGGGSMKENLAQLVRHPRYQVLPDVTDGVNPTGRTDLIGRVIHQRQAAALAQVRREFPQINDHILSVRREKALGKVPRDILAFVK